MDPNSGGIGLQLPQFWMKRFSLPALSLESLNPKMGIAVPSSQGLFPWQRSQSFLPSQQANWGPAQNLANPPPLAPERQAALHQQRQRAVLGWLAQVDPATALGEDHIAELHALRIPTSGHSTVGDLLQALRPPKLQTAEIDALPDEAKALLKEARPDVWRWYLGGTE